MTAAPAVTAGANGTTGASLPLLELCQLRAGYGKSLVLHGVDLAVGAGEIVALLGRNGSGRSTTVKAAMGLVEGRGSVRWRGEEVLGRKPFEIARLGLGYVPESRDVFPTLSVHENLMLGERPRPRGWRRGGLPGGEPAPHWSCDALYALFPPLAARRHTEAGVLSGGEQQMLSLARTLGGGPQLVMVDEPTEGLAPKLVEVVAGCLLELQRRGVAVLLVEQKLTIALEVSQRCAVMGQGRIVFDGTPAGLAASAYIRKEWLEV